MNQAAPEGFDPHYRKSPVTAPWEPLYSRIVDNAVQIGLWLGEAHCNSRGFVHGGVLAALADNAMGLSYINAGRAAGHDMQGAVTVSLSVDYAGSAKLGTWLVIQPRVIKAGRNMGFVDAIIMADGAPVARASSTFRAT